MSFVVQSRWLSFCLLHVDTYWISSHTNIEPGWFVGPTAGTGCMPLSIIDIFNLLLSLSLALSSKLPIGIRGSFKN